jgi:hypothetical protein
MITRDDVLLAEAYISAYKKTPELPFEDVTDTAPDTDGAVEMHSEPGAVVLSLGTGEEEPECGCSGESPEEHEEEEISMAKTNLFSIFRHAQMLHDMLESGVEVDTWMFQKIAVVADKLADVARVVEYHAAKNGVVG